MAPGLWVMQSEGRAASMATWGVTPQPQNSGNSPARIAGGSPKSGRMMSPTPIASGPSITPRTLAIDAENVYVIHADFSVTKSALDGSDAMAPISLAALDGLDIPSAIATDGAYVYWTVVAMGGTPAVMKCPVAGCDNQPTTLAAGLIIKIIIVVALAKAVGAAVAYQRSLSAAPAT